MRRRTSCSWPHSSAGETEKIQRWGQSKTESNELECKQQRHKKDKVRNTKFNKRSTTHQNPKKSHQYKSKVFQKLNTEAESLSFEFNCFELISKWFKCRITDDRVLIQGWSYTLIRTFPFGAWMFQFSVSLVVRGRVSGFPLQKRRVHQCCFLLSHRASGEHVTHCEWH